MLLHVCSTAYGFDSRLAVSSLDPSQPFGALHGDKRERIYAMYNNNIIRTLKGLLNWNETYCA